MPLSSGLEVMFWLAGRAKLPGCGSALNLRTNKSMCKYKHKYTYKYKSGAWELYDREAPADAHAVLKDLLRKGCREVVHQRRWRGVLQRLAGCHFLAVDVLEH